MKSRFMKTVFLAFLTMLVPVVSYAGTVFSVSPHAGFAYGGMNKYIFSSKAEQKLSCLEWETKPLWTAGLNLDVEKENFGVLLAFDYGLPADCGKMYDSDYYYNNEYPQGNVCNYSISDNEALKNINTEIGFYFRFGSGTCLEIIPRVGAQYTFDSFVSKNGHGWYGRDAYSKTGKNEPWDSDAAIKVRILGVEYYRHTLYTWLGCQLRTGFFATEYGNRLNLDFAFYLSPFTYTSAMDHHLSKKGNDYHQQEIEYSHFTRIRWNFGAEYKLNGRLSLLLDSDWIYGSLEKGNTYSDKNNSTGKVKISQKTGADVFQYRMNLGFRYRISREK